jgi:hypothetical protein
VNILCSTIVAIKVLYGESLGHSSMTRNSGAGLHVCMVYAERCGSFAASCIFEASFSVSSPCFYARVAMLLPAGCCLIQMSNNSIQTASWCHGGKSSPSSQHLPVRN